MSNNEKLVVGVTRAKRMVANVEWCHEVAEIGSFKESQRLNRRPVAEEGPIDD